MSEVSCLKALAKFEFGDDLKGNGKPLVIYGIGAKVYTWEGRTISIYPRGTNLKETPKSDQQWSIEKYEENKDGRLNRSTPSADINGAVKRFVSLSFSAFADKRLKPDHYRNEIFSGCAQVDTVKYKNQTLENFIEPKLTRSEKNTSPNTPTEGVR